MQYTSEGFEAILRRSRGEIRDVCGFCIALAGLDDEDHLLNSPKGGRVLLPPLSFSQTSLPNWEDALQGVLFVFVSDLTVNDRSPPPSLSSSSTCCCVCH